MEDEEVEDEEVEGEEEVKEVGEEVEDEEEQVEEEESESVNTWRCSGRRGGARGGVSFWVRHDRSPTLAPANQEQRTFISIRAAVVRLCTGGRHGK